MTQIKSNGFVADQSIIDTQNKLSEVLNLSNEQLVALLGGIPADKLPTYLKSIKNEVTLFGTAFTIPRNGVSTNPSYNILRDNRIDISKSFRDLGMTVGRTTKDLDYLVMLYLEMLTNQPLSMAGINKAEALAKYSAIKESVLETEQTTLKNKM